MTSQEIRQKYIKFFEERGHKAIPSASLKPENDPSLLFTTAGMHPLVPYLIKGNHPQGQRLVNVQKCLRTDDIEEIGDTYHHTFFEMLGNWSIGDPNSKDLIGENGYWKNDSIKWSYELLTSKDWFGLDHEKIAVSVFEGDNDAPFDKESYDIWRELGIDEKRIIGLPKQHNWWGQVLGPCGPNTEIFYWSGGGKAPKAFDHEDERWLEIWNNVFMEYNRKVKRKNKNGKPIDFFFEPLAQKNVDTGMGLERIITVLDKVDDDYLSDLFTPIIEKIGELSGKSYQENKKAFRVIADHVKAAVFILSEEITPSNVDRGYIARRLIRRAIRYGKTIGLEKEFITEVCEPIFEIYKNIYPEIEQNKSLILEELAKEEAIFIRTLGEGLKKADDILEKKNPISEEEYSKIMQLDKKGDILKRIYHGDEEMADVLPKYGIAVSNKAIRDAYITGKEAFYLYQTYGFPIEMIIELAQAKKLFVTITDFKKEAEKHQQLSRTASAGKFKGGLADEGEETIRLHTAAHLLLAALRQVLSENVIQKGSNITAERLRFDFSHPQKMTDEEIKKVEKLVNQKISEAIPVTMQEMSLDEAKKSGAHGTFADRYGDQVKVYIINDFSKEICGGPHVDNTSKIGRFKIVKEESSSSGVRRIKAVVE